MRDDRTDERACTHGCQRALDGLWMPLQRSSTPQKSEVVRRTLLRELEAMACRSNRRGPRDGC
jgi:hypothetical protein